MLQSPGPKVHVSSRVDISVSDPPNSTILDLDLPAAVAGLGLGYVLMRRQDRRDKQEGVSTRFYLILGAFVLGFVALFDSLLCCR
jgi:hypothetical protein